MRALVFDISLPPLMESLPHTPSFLPSFRICFCNRMFDVENWKTTHLSKDLHALTVQLLLSKRKKISERKNTWKHKCSSESCYTAQTQKCLLFVIFHFFMFQDGTFLVRDSSRKTVTHPYVLMVLYRDKVYNIQIRYQEQEHLYLLGTSLKGKEVLCVFHSLRHLLPHYSVSGDCSPGVEFCLLS